MSLTSQPGQNGTEAKEFRRTQDNLARTTSSALDRADPQKIQKALREDGIRQELKRLKRPSAARLAGALLFDWSVILLAFLTCVCLSWWILPLALVLIANR